MVSFVEAACCLPNLAILFFHELGWSCLGEDTERIAFFSSVLYARLLCDQGTEHTVHVKLIISVPQKGLLGRSDLSIGLLSSSLLVWLV